MASQILGLVCLLFCFIAGTEGIVKRLECYKCKTNNPNDSCFTNPTSVAKTKCLPHINKCVVRRTYDKINNNVSEFERDCELNVPLFGDETMCKDSGNFRECQVICGDDFCNDVPEAQVEQCANTMCKGSAAINTVMTPLILVAAISKFIF